PISTFSRVWSQVLSAMASAERVFTVLDLKPETGSSAQEGYIELPRLEGEVVFENVSFAYKPGEQVLSGISFKVSPGETIALVGPTGAGKTTIINLLARFYQPSSGKITVDGYDLAEVSLPSYRSQLGIVLQDTLIFSGTIKDNLLFGKPDATMDEVVRAAKAACIHDFIESLPKGYDSEVTERGTNLSAGQRQLLAFARAILADPRILILDEATSSVDPETEQLIQQALKTLLKGRTSFIIAHRLSTVRSADRIMVIEDGQITESGTHDELVALGGRYANLYQAQFRRA
ncbi:MAG TPA: multidrug ABC transporter ATP-binding protein, partial [Clostridiales bacterium UBA9857]|nr:multidrug ABC transporter ATP-binding protein [Clostridiales bacterium UBA9857]